MANNIPQASFHFVTFEDSKSKARGGKPAEKSRARAHAARVTHSRRKAKRGQTVVKWITKGPDDGIVSVPKRADDQQVFKIEEVVFDPVSMLSQAKVDPFETSQHAILPAAAQQIMEYGLWIVTLLDA
jgi:hypothetical protein